MEKVAAMDESEDPTATATIRGMSRGWAGVEALAQVGMPLSQAKAGAGGGQQGPLP